MPGISTTGSPSSVLMHPCVATICGLTGGYDSRTAGRETYVLEDHRCMGKGDAACRVFGPAREDEEWGDERSEKRLAIEGSVRPLDEVEREYILAALELNSGNQTRTARDLRIGSATLYRRLKSYGVIGSKRPRHG